jgi:colanic acid/amylovoran biosynthesis protein
MKHALLTSITGMRNRGVEALVASSVQQMRQRNPELPISILTKTPDYDALRTADMGRVRLFDEKVLHPRASRLKRSLGLVFPQYRAEGSPQYREIAAVIADASAVIASGGDVFSSVYGSLHRHLKPLELALEAEVPVIFLAQSIGPFSTPAEAKAWLAVAQRSALISVREAISYRYVTEELGLAESKVTLTADPAFLLEATDATTVSSMLAQLGIARGQPLIGIAASRGISRFTASDSREHQARWGSLISRILKELDVQVLLIPHVQDTFIPNDDRLLATEILRSLGFPPRLHLAGADHTAAEFKGLISMCDLVIAERMHAAIAGLSSAVCTLAIGYSIKAGGILSRLLGEHFAKEVVIPFEDFLDPDIAWSRLISAWGAREPIAATLREALIEVRAEAALNFDLIAQLIGEPARTAIGPEVRPRASSSGSRRRPGG